MNPDDMADGSAPGEVIGKKGSRGGGDIAPIVNSIDSLDMLAGGLKSGGGTGGLVGIDEEEAEGCNGGGEGSEGAYCKYRNQRRIRDEDGLTCLPWFPGICHYCD